LKTDLGDIVIGLFTESSPVAAENFLNLVSAGYYDGLTFHRLVPGFVIQGGDPAGDGSGGPGYTIPDEPVVGRYGRGIVSMARTPEPDSQGSQFFVVLDDGAEPVLEDAGAYAIFGRVVEGMDVVDAIAAMPNAGEAEGNRAIDPVTITSATVEEVTLSPEPSREPLPPTGAPDLEALFPTEIAGSPLDIRSFNPTELATQFPAGAPGTIELEAILGTQGRTIADLSVANGGVQTEDGFATIVALRVAGADAAALLDGLATLVVGSDSIERTATRLGGKDVAMLLAGPGGPSVEPVYAYPSGDVLWFVGAQEPLLSQVFSSLP
jgi:peptidyl-prolyl cis-trans isomerase B (cyclophilin B)